MSRSRSYRAGNAIHLGYKYQSVSAVKENNRCLFWDPYKTHTYIQTHTHTHINTYIHTHTHTHTYIHTYIHTWMLKLVLHKSNYGALKGWYIYIRPTLSSVGRMPCLRRQSAKYMYGTVICLRTRILFFFISRELLFILKQIFMSLICNISVSTVTRLRDRSWGTCNWLLWGTAILLFFVATSAVRLHGVIELPRDSVIYMYVLKFLWWIRNQYPSKWKLFMCLEPPLYFLESGLTNYASCVSCHSRQWPRNSKFE